MKKILTSVCLLIVTFSSNAQVEIKKDTILTNNVTPVVEKKKWHELLSIRGYSQLRYNRLLANNDNYKNDQGDKSMGYGGGIYFRRARLVLSGNVSDKVYVYSQIECAQGTPLSSSNSFTGLNFLQLRDFYGDIFLNKDKNFKLRLGLTKVPFGYDNLQSSQLRICFDRSDAINSSVYNERETGAFLFWTPTSKKALFKKIVEDGLKGTGDYGVFAFGVYNGQSTNRSEKNDDLYNVLRFAYPIEFSNGQICEFGIQGIRGYANLTETKTALVKDVPDNVLEQRIAGTFVMYPKPIGFQGEFVYGESPEFTKLTPTHFTIKNQKIMGGYAMLTYRKKINEQVFIPYCRYNYMKGGKRIETDARSYLVSELEGGVEWSPFYNLEITASYVYGSRRAEDSKTPNNTQLGKLLRLQVQFNY